MRYRYEVL